MRALRVVGYGEEGVVILEDPERRERFTVPADERLRAAARGDVQQLGQMSMELESQLRPREIQARIRAGESVEQVAAAAGVPLQRIERFAYPVLLERARISEMARQAHPIRDDGPDVRTLSEVVASTFTLRGQEYEKAEWDAWRGEDHKWVVTLSWRAGHSDITAHWAYHPGAHGGTVTPLDEHATDLIDGQPARPPRRVGPVIDFSKSAATASQSSAADVDGEPRTASATRSARASGAASSGTSSRGAAKSGTEKSSASKSGTSKSSAGKSRSSSGAGRTTDQTTERTSTTKRGRKGKPVMPSWEDVLLGVKRS